MNQSILSIVIAILLLVLTGCGSGSSSSGSLPATLSCSGVGFEPGTLQYEDGAIGSQLVVNLNTGMAQFTTASQSCTHTVGNLAGLISTIKTVSYCSADASSAINIEIRSTDSLKSLKMNQASAKGVTISGGFDAFQSDMTTLMAEVQSQGVCAAN